MGLAVAADLGPRAQDVGERRAAAARTGRAALYRAGIKRSFDLAFGLLILPPVALLVGLLCLLVRRDGGPGFFDHQRVGRDGRPFRCWKLRSTIPDATAVLQAHLAGNPEAAREWAEGFKLRDDPCVTRLGQFLHRTSLDELPQLWNILRGEMSLVGPRPVTAIELDRYKGYEWCHMSMRPGLTGLWQVSGRNDVDYEQRVRMDLAYAARCSFLIDLGIILRTFGAVLARTGR